MSEDVFTLNTQVQAVIERAKEDARVLRDGSFRDNAMQVIVELDSRLKQAQQREHAAYERGKAEERARIAGMLEAEDKAHDSLMTATVFAFHIKQGFGSGLRRAIAIVNQTE